jgi:hypothetical protein
MFGSEGYKQKKSAQGRDCIDQKNTGGSTVEDNTSK